MSNAVHAVPPVETEDRRYSPRRALRLRSAASDSGIEVVIHDLSLTGMLVETHQELGTGEILFVDLPERGPTAACVVWSSGRFHGCSFEESIPTAAVSAALLQSPASMRIESASSAFDISSLRELAGGTEADEPVDDRYSLRTRGIVMSGLLVSSWTAIGWAITALR